MRNRRGKTPKSYQVHRAGSRRIKRNRSMRNRRGKTPKPYQVHRAGSRRRRSRVESTVVQLTLEQYRVRGINYDAVKNSGRTLELALHMHDLDQLCRVLQYIFSY